MSRILVVDDEKEIRVQIIGYLKTLLDVEIIEADGGHLALKLLQSEAFDLVTSDLCMWEGNGFELFVQMQRKKISIPLIFLPAHTEGLIEMASPLLPLLKSPSFLFL